MPRETGIWVAAIGCGIVVVARLYRDSTTGLKLRAGREDPIAAAAIGINVPRERFVALVVMPG
ncbi:MAG: hypothetical protein R3D80_20465 [Paracoccaceae bacterium]